MYNAGIHFNTSRFGTNKVGGLIYTLILLLFLFSGNMYPFSILNVIHVMHREKVSNATDQCEPCHHSNRFPGYPHTNSTKHSEQTKLACLDGRTSHNERAVQSMRSAGPQQCTC